MIYLGNYKYNNSFNRFHLRSHFSCKSTHYISYNNSIAMKEKNDNAIRKRIIRKCTEIFLRNGFAKISMDEIAQSLGMSKKTIYKHFSNKEDLVKTVIISFRDQTLSRIESILDDEDIDTYLRLVKMLEATGEQLSKIQRPVLEDIKKHLPDFWIDVEKRRRTILKQVYGKIIADAKKERIVRQDTDEDFFILMYMSLITSIVNPEVMADLNYSASQVFRNIVKTLFTGILTDEARNKYESKYLN